MTTQSSALYTGPTAEDLDRIPADLKARPQWVLFRLEEVISKKTGEVKLTKIPMNPHTRSKASTTNKKTWGTFEQCLAALPAALTQWEDDDPSTYRGGGIGFVLTKDDPYQLVDMDDSIDPETDIILPWARAIVDTLASYTQRSVGRQGLHTLVKGTLPPGGSQHGDLQMWDHDRFCAMTGWHLAGTPATIEARQSQVTMVHAAHILKPKMEQQAAKRGAKTDKRRTTSLPPRLSDNKILAKAREAKNRAKFTALWAGDTSGYPSQSEADAALCTMLAFWTRDASQIDSLFRQSDLYREDKWNDRDDYRERTITYALEQQTTQYDPTIHTRAQDAQQRRNGSDASPEVAQAQDDTKLPYSDVYNPLPTIEITTKMEDIVDSTEAAIRVLPHGPHLFQRARQLVCISRTAPAPKWLRRPADMPVIMTATLAHVRELASMAATWEKYDKRSHTLEPALPPPWVAETLRDRGGWKFPVLEGIVSTPTLLPDGSILDRPGYDQETGLFVALDRPYPPVPLRPTFDDARSALGLLQQPFMDFLFDDTSPANFSATLAALLTVLCRYTIQGDVPLFAVTATTRRSGKGLLVDVISIIATGRTAPRWAQPRDRDGDEERKRMLAIGLAGDPLILIDNLTRPLGSEALDIALTCQGTFADRTLGTHQIKEAPMHAVFFATGNNITYKADTAPRVVPIALDPKMERPEERTGFQQDDLRAWVRNERPRLVTAALTLMRAYFEAGCPQQSIIPMGGFEAWSALVRQALGWAGEADPLAGQKTLALEHDTGSENLRSLLVSWEACYKDKAATLKHVRQDIGLYAAQRGEPANTWDDLRDALGAFDLRYVGERFDITTVGYALRGLQGRVLDGKRLGSEAQGTNTRQWRVLPL